jgi:hypothetical protein
VLALGDHRVRDLVAAGGGAQQRLAAVGRVRCGRDQAVRLQRGDGLGDRLGAYVLDLRQRGGGDRPVLDDAVQG